MNDYYEQKISDAEETITERYDEIAELKAHVERLRNAHKQNCCHFGTEAQIGMRKRGEEVLKETPAQSLAEHDKKVREECAALCEKNNLMGGVYIGGNGCAKAIREMKQ